MKNSTSKILLHIRKFLNRASDSLQINAITARIVLDTWRNERPMRESDYEYINASLAISTPNGQLSFNVGFNEESYSTDLKELNVLVNTINKFKKGILEAKKIKDSIEERKVTDSKISGLNYAINGNDSEGWDIEDELDD